MSSLGAVALWTWLRVLVWVFRWLMPATAVNGMGAERALEDCSFCLVRDVIVSEAQAAEHNRFIDAKNALLALRGQIRRDFFCSKRCTASSPVA